MKLEDFVIGEPFWMGGDAWRCTDKGTRVIVAVKLAGWTVPGGPQNQHEHVVNEDDMQGCAPTEAAWRTTFEDAEDS